jgi:integrase
MASVKLKFRPSTVEGKEGTLFFQVIHNRVVRQCATNYRISNEEWSEEQSTIINGVDDTRNRELSALRERLRWDTERLHHLIGNFESKRAPYSADDVIAEFERISREHTLFNFMERIIVQLKLRGKVRTSETYQATLNSFKRYRNDEDLMLDALTSDELLLYESYMAQRGVCPNTTSFYMRILRAVYNKAVEKGLIEQKNPFTHVYTGVSKTIKRALVLPDIKRLKDLDLSLHPALAFARDLFLFSFYMRGMSFIDMAHLRKMDMKGGIISYRRHKTGQQLVVKVEQCAQEIIDRYHDETSNYLLPIITGEGDERHQYRNALHAINNRLKEIGKMIGSPIKLTTYVGRHSWASAAKSSNIPISVISESMGHENERTTQIYLASIDTSLIDDANAKILSSL